MVDAPELAYRLERAMEAKGLGVRELAQLTKVDKGTISAWRSGTQRQVRVETARKVAAKLGTTVEQLLDMPPEAPTGTGAVSAARQQELLRRVAALKPTLTALSAPPVNLVAALNEHGERLATIEQVLPTLRQLAVTADEVTDSAKP